MKLGRMDPGLISVSAYAPDFKKAPAKLRSGYMQNPHNVMH
jgi:hypothetical protein